MALASLPKRKKIRIIMIIILSRSAVSLDANVGGGISETLDRQLCAAMPILDQNESSWTSVQNTVWSVIEDIYDAFTSGNPTTGDLETLSGDLETALAAL